MFKNIAFYISYKLKARYVELGFSLDLYNPKEYSILLELLGNYNDVLKINHTYIFRSFPKDFLNIWNISPEFLKKFQLTDKQRESFCYYLMYCCKSSYYTALSELFLVLNNQNIIRTKNKLDYKLIYEKRFKSFVKGSRFVEYTTHEAMAAEYAKKDNKSIVKKIQLDLMNCTKNLKKIKIAEVFTENQLNRIETFYKSIIKNTLTCMKLTKTEDWSKLTAKISVNKDLSFDISLAE